jgi:hypothetical protein
MTRYYDELLTHPDRWSWSLGLEHESVAPASPLPTGRLDPAPPLDDACCAVGQFDSAHAAAHAADTLAGVCVGLTVILPGLPHAVGLDDRRQTQALDALRALGAGDPFITDSDTGYVHAIDVRADLGTSERALEIGRRLVVVPHPFGTGLRPPWAPGPPLTEAELQARLYLTALSQVDRVTHEYVDLAPHDNLESQVRQVWRRYVEQQRKFMRNYQRPATREEVDRWVERSKAFVEDFRRLLHPLMGGDPNGVNSPWIARYELLVDGPYICVGGLWFLRFASGFPTLVAWLQRLGIDSAMYAVYNFMRP